MLKTLASITSCLYFFYIFVFSACFLGGTDVFKYLPTFLQDYLPSKTVDLVQPLTKEAASYEPEASVIARDLFFLALFAVQHSVMTRPWFKKALSQFIPQFLEHNLYMLASSATLHLLMNQWVPITKPLYTTYLIPASTQILPILYLLGVGLAFLHVGLSAFKTIFSSERPSEEPFSEGLLNQVSRHPAYLGFLIMLWSHPVMTYGRFLFAAVMTVYIFLAIQFEEQDLEVRYGEAYVAYKRRTPMLIPTRYFGGPAVPAPRVAARAD